MFIDSMANMLVIFSAINYFLGRQIYLYVVQTILRHPVDEFKQGPPTV